MAKTRTRSRTGAETPQEIAVWYVLPALRSEFANVLIKDFKLSQKDVARLMRITESAVSQYMSKKRAKARIEFSSSARKAIKMAAKRVIDGSPILKEMQIICNMVTVKKIVCVMCKSKHEKMGDCLVCFR